MPSPSPSPSPDPSFSPTLTTSDSDQDIEMSHLDEVSVTPNPYKAGGSHHPPVDDYDSDDGDNGERALLSPKAQARWRDKSPGDPGSIWRQTHTIVWETLPTLLFTTVGLLFTGELLDTISHWRAMTRINELIMIVPVILNLKGNIEMNLSARLSTAANMGDLDTPSVRNTIILGNLALLQVQAAAVSFIAACVSFFLSAVIPGVGDESRGPALSEPRNAAFHYLRSHGHDHRRPRPLPPAPGAPKSGFNEFMMVASTAMSAACLSAILLGSFMSFLIVLCRRFGRDPDNIAPPVAACLGDLVTMTLLGVTSTLLILGIGTATPFITIGLIATCAVACAFIVRRNEHVAPLLKDGWTPLLGAMIITSGSGIVLDMFVSRYEGYALLAVAFGGVPGGTGSIFVSRLSTALHAAAYPAHDALASGAGSAEPDKHARHEPAPRLVMLVLFLVAIPVTLVFFLILRVSGWLSAPFTFSLVALFFLCIAICISLTIARLLTGYLWAHGHDPDVYALPIHSALMDLCGQLLLVSSFEVASALGIRVRSRSPA
ncbi:hypothetical protein BC834DRAFT_894338 [Gloeopeniophorella convolvens]|nr:hypothetical protein BC834DRAFT_894338 [Gloeopeniophorella convolvens]